MRFRVFFLAILLLIGCGRKDKTDSQAGTASQAYSEVISSSSGYIIQNAKIIVNNTEPAIVNLNSALKLGNANTSVMVIRGSNVDNTASTILALQFPSFAEGTMTEFDGSAQSAQFIIYGMQNGSPVVKESGLISGSIRCVKTQPSTINLGLNREITDGTGTMEVLVSNIQPAGFNYVSSKKYNAQYTLPIIKLEELARLNVPS